MVSRVLSYRSPWMMSAIPIEKGKRPAAAEAEPRPAAAASQGVTFGQGASQGMVVPVYTPSPPRPPLARGGTPYKYGDQKILQKILTS